MVPFSGLEPDRTGEQVDFDLNSIYHPGESFGLKFILNQSEFFRIIPEFASESNSFTPI